jgi:hypothetical protein
MVDSFIMKLESMWLKKKMKERQVQKIHGLSAKCKTYIMREIIGCTPGISSKHFNCFTYNDLIKRYYGETSNDAFDVKVSNEMAASTEYANKAQSIPLHDGMDSFLVGLIVRWHQMFSGLKRPMEAEADTWILDYGDIRL